MWQAWAMCFILEQITNTPIYEFLAFLSNKAYKDCCHSRFKGADRYSFPIVLANISTYLQNAWINEIQRDKVEMLLS